MNVAGIIANVLTRRQHDARQSGVTNSDKTRIGDAAWGMRGALRTLVTVVTLLVIRLV